MPFNKCDRSSNGDHERNHFLLRFTCRDTNERYLLPP
ncbi:uncharacterized protein G2W53_008427 [Senna tora]|uniref:Uncharacterized protein n=1 Tax=Senna tora TaxID=362788 RepID=A0A834X8H3_9FABA|nr:uncharacterized protein G2W53_008427 [Senna tora]